MNRQPNLFIVGAPKCGTTSLARWLAQHPDIFVPEVKEPHHYNREDKGMYYADKEAYLALFGNGKRYRYRLDSSVWYLRSQHAVPAILDDCPEARFIICLRNPVDMAFSLYSQALNRSGSEDVTPFEKAWSLSDARLQGRRVSSLIKDPVNLAYKYSCQIGSQSERLLSQVRRNHVHFVVLDDLISSTEQSLSEILDFLNIEKDVDLIIPHDNARVSARRFPSLHRFVVKLSRMRKAFGMGGKRTGLGKCFRTLNSVGGVMEMKSETRRMVTEFFLSEIEKIWEVTGVIYPEWVECMDAKEEHMREGYDDAR